MRDARVAHSGIVIKSFKATQVRRSRRFTRWKKLDGGLCSPSCMGSTSVSESDASGGVDRAERAGVESTEGSLVRSWVGELGKDLKKVVRRRGLYGYGGVGGRDSTSTKLDEEGSTSTANGARRGVRSSSRTSGSGSSEAERRCTP